jgi:hypothetical protein
LFGGHDQCRHPFAIAAVGHLLEGGIQRRGHKIGVWPCKFGQHEACLPAKSGRISASGTTDMQKIFKKNTKRMNYSGFAFIPTIVGKHAQTGERVKQEGAMLTRAHPLVASRLP